MQLGYVQVLTWGPSVQQAGEGSGMVFGIV